MSTNVLKYSATCAAGLMSCGHVTTVRHTSARTRLCVYEQPSRLQCGLINDRYLLCVCVCE